MRKQLSVEEFKRLAQAKELPEDYVVRQTFATEVEVELDAEGKAASASRTLTFTISTPTVDRQGDTVSIDGWKLDSYNLNPVVQWAHNYSMPPIARSTKTWKHSGKLKSTAEFVPADNPAIGPFAEGILQLYKGKFLSAVSVGFMPRKWNWAEDESRKYGIDFVEQELLEYSCVPVPANPDALVEGRSVGGDDTQLREWARGVLKAENGLYEVLPAVSAETMRRIGAEGLTEELAADPQIVRLQEALAGLLKPAPKNLLNLYRYDVELQRLKAAL